MRLIDADVLKENLKLPEESGRMGELLGMVINAVIEDAPTIEERKTGKWIKIPEFCGDGVSGFIDNHFSCSECKKEAEINTWGFYILSDFCPNCGADMRE